VRLKQMEKTGNISTAMPAGGFPAGQPLRG